MLAANQPRQIPPLLILGSITGNLVDAQIGVRAVGQADGGGRPRNFLHRDHVLQVAHGGAAVLFRDRDAQQTHRAHLRPEVHGEGVILVDRRRTGRDFGGGEGFHLIAQHVRGLPQIEVQAREAVGDGGHEQNPSSLNTPDCKPNASGSIWAKVSQGDGP